jgi:hypothetical protein
MIELKEKMKELKELRDKANTKKIQLDNAYENFNSMMEDEVAEYDMLVDFIENKEKYIREAVIEDYRKDLEKHRDFGIEVKILKSIKYSEDNALKFAKDHGLFLQLDKKGFEKFAKENYAKEGDIIRIVDMIEEPKVYLPTKIEVD